MKKVFLIAGLFTASLSFGQLQMKEVPREVSIGKATRGGYVATELLYRVLGADTIYTFRYINSKWEKLIEYKSISFNADSATLNTIYKMLKGFFSDEHKKDKEYKLNFKLGNTDVIASNVRSFGMNNIMFYTSEGYCYLSEKMVDKTFGKE